MRRYGKIDDHPVRGVKGSFELISETVEIGVSDVAGESFTAVATDQRGTTHNPIQYR